MQPVYYYRSTRQESLALYRLQLSVKLGRIIYDWYCLENLLNLHNVKQEGLFLHYLFYHYQLDNLYAQKFQLVFPGNQIK